MLGLKLNHVSKRGPLVTNTGMYVLNYHFTFTKAGLLSILSIRTYFIEIWNCFKDMDSEILSVRSETYQQQQATAGENTWNTT